MSQSNEWKPGQDCQAVATANLLGQSPDNIHGDTWGIVGTLGDSICYAGGSTKVDAIQKALGERIVSQKLPLRLIAPNYARKLGPEKSITVSQVLLDESS